MESKILLIDDHPLLREGMAMLFERLADSVTVIEAESLQEGLRCLQLEDDFDVVLLDLKLPDSQGFNGLISLKEQSPGTPVVVLSAYDDHTSIVESLRHGAQGYIPKSSSGDVIIHALRIVLAGEVYIPRHALDFNHSVETERFIEAPAQETDLTLRQKDVLKLLAEGFSNKQIGYKLNMADGTVRVHISAIFRKLGVNNRTKAGLKAVQLGLLESESTSL